MESDLGAAGPAAGPDKVIWRVGPGGTPAVNGAPHTGAHTGATKGAVSWTPTGALANGGLSNGSAGIGDRLLRAKPASSDGDPATSGLSVLEPLAAEPLAAEPQSSASQRVATTSERDDASRGGWAIRYSRVIMGYDLAVLVGACAIGAWLGLGNGPTTPYVATVLGAVTTIGIVIALVITGSWEPRSLGQGSEEFGRLLRAITSSLVLLGLTGLLVDSPSTRYWVFGVIPIVGVTSAVGRYALRKALYRRRAKGQCMHSVLAVGAEDSVADLIDRTSRARYHGWVVTGVCTPRGKDVGGSRHVSGVPVVGDMDSIAATALSGGYQVVTVAPCDGWSARRLHQLAWDLEGNGIELVVHPGLMQVSGPRLHVAPVDGLPLLRLTEPRFTGFPWVIKTAVDQIVAGLAIILLAPLLVGLYLAVRADGGPGFFRQTRVGRRGKTFDMIKFRSMVPDAERRRHDLLPRNEAAGPLFKLRVDPRVTKVGRLLRRYSLDELPQLFNVLGGSMSLVGPRPPLPEEVSTYGPDARRKLLVKPGLTGLWQISGRSQLSWEESVRLDMHYVENWNLALDVLILWKTIRAVTKGDGAY